MSYLPRRAGTSHFVAVRGLDVHVTTWGTAAAGPPLVALHGWMDVGASFQFVVDALHHERLVFAPDWRGFGRSASPPGTDSYWFPDYLGDLDALLDALAPGTAVDLLGHSMGGNVVMSYAGLRPQRVRRLINLEGFGLPATKAEMAPQRLLEWLDSLKTAQALKSYDSLDAVATRLRKNNPRLPADKAAWLATHWSALGDDGRRHILGDPAHKRANPVLYQVDEVLATWRRIAAPLLWVEGDSTELAQWWGNRYSKAEFHQRLNVVPKVERHTLADCGHMLHHDQPQALAALIETFLDQ